MVRTFLKVYGAWLLFVSARTNILNEKRAERESKQVQTCFLEGTIVFSIRYKCVLYQVQMCSLEGTNVFPKTSKHTHIHAQKHTSIHTHTWPSARQRHIHTPLHAICVNEHTCYACQRDMLSVSKRIHAIHLSVSNLASGTDTENPFWYCALAHPENIFCLLRTHSRDLWPWRDGR